MPLISGRNALAPVLLSLSHNASSDSDASQLYVVNEPSDNRNTESEVD